MRKHFFSNRFFLFFFAALSLGSAALYMSSCTKDSSDTAQPNVQNNQSAVADRAPFQYGVTVWAPGAPSKIVNLNTGTTAAVPNVPDLKGICVFNGGSGDYYVTSGLNNPAGLRNRMFKVNPATGAILASYGPAAGYPATVSDICMIDFAPLNMYGLKDNNNTLAAIGYPTFLTATYTGMTGIAAGYTAKGLSWTRNPVSNLFELVAFCTRPGGPGKCYVVNTTTGFCTYYCDFNPPASFNGNNCGAGYFYFPNKNILINRSPASSVLGTFPWTTCPLAAAVTAFGPGADYEDLASILY